MNFRELLEAVQYEITDEFHEFIDYLYDYMDLYEKDKIPNIIKLAEKLKLIDTKAKVFRVTCKSGDNDNSIDFGDFDLVSTSTSKLKGKVLQGIIDDMQDRYKHYKKKECELVYVELSNVKGIDITQLSKFILANKNEFEDYIVDMFKRLKSEKEFLAYNKNLTIKKVEVV